MKKGPHPFNHLAAPIKSLAQRFAFMALLLAAFALMMLGRVDAALMERVRTRITDVVAPILDLVSQPIKSLNMTVGQVREIYQVLEENAELREQNARLLQWQATARRLEAENIALHSLLNFVPGPEASVITARVIADTGGAFAHSLVLNAGSRNNVRKGQAAVTGDGLVGRIAGVGTRSSRLLLITDLNSRIPVLVESVRTRAILAGNNSDQPRLLHLPSGATVGRGDRIVTSGHGGAFPVGLPVGVVASVNENGIGIQPFVTRNRLEYVRVLDYGLSGILKIAPVPSRGEEKTGKVKTAPSGERSSEP